MSMKMKFGSKDIPFVYKGDKLIYPNPIKDGLLLWYDFKGMSNTDTNKEVAKDLSGNGNDGALINFNFTEESGYKDNALVFDGVDDSLTIPELELDETAMTVMHDGKIYSYEDDKVLTVGEDGEVIGSGKNLVYNTSFTSTEGWRTITSKILGVNNNEISLEVIEGIAWNALMSAEENSVYIEEGVPYTLTYEINLETPLASSGILLLGFSNYGIPDKAGYVLSGNVTNQLDNNKLNEWQTITTTVIPEKSEESTLYIRFGIPEKNTVLRIRNVMVEKGTKRNWRTLSPKDFMKSEYTPPSMNSLQLYNKTLNKTELLHNVESKGLKELKPGVIVQDGLVLHYDFSHESNTSEYKDKAFDYSGNGNHGVLNNFNFTEESGYKDKGLKYDNVDDFVTPNLRTRVADFTIMSTVYFSEENSGMIWGGTPSAFYLRRNLGHGLHGSIYISGGEGIAGKQLSTTASNIFVTNEAKKINVGMIVDNESQTYSLIVNGEIIRSISISGELETAPFLLTHVGAWPTLNYSNLDGSMHSFQMYNRALTPEEIAHNYQIEKEKFNIVEGEI